MSDLKQKLSEAFTEVMDITLPITIIGLLVFLWMFYTGKLDQKAWMEMTELFYDGGLMRMWALIAAAVLAKWADAVINKG